MPTLADSLAALRSGQTTSLALTESYLQTITQSKLNAYLTVTADLACERAAAIDVAGDYTAPLAGIPVGIKDIICTKGVATTGASKILENYIPPYSATAWQRLEDAGAVLLGKLNCDEFAMGSTTENSAYGVTRNPADLERVPGGSSGGSAAAVAGGECVFSLGTDTGGSIRQPAHFCGCVGLKPTYGRVSRSGVMAYASSFDTVGPLTQTVTDAAMVLQVLAGHDRLDSTTSQVEVPDYVEQMQQSVAGMTIGVPKIEGISPQMQAVIDAGSAKLEAAGVRVQEITIPLLDAVIPTYYLLVKAEASTNMSRYDGIRYGAQVDTDTADLTTHYLETRGELFGPEVKRAIMMGTFTLSSGYIDAYYQKAAKVRTLLIQEFNKLFTQVDAILMPVAPTSAWKIGDNSDDPIAMYLTDIFTVGANLVGIPGLSVPVLEQDGLPNGLQILTRQFDEGRMLALGYALETR